VPAGLKKQMVEDLKRACLPLRDYIRQYDSFIEFMNMDLTEYVRSYEEKEASLSEDEKEIEKLIAQKQQVLDYIPQFITIGMFNIKLESINRSLSAKYDQLIRMIMSLIAEKASAKAKTIIAKYSKFYERLTTPYSTIEEVAELEDFIKEIPKETEELVVMVSEMIAQAEVLDKFNFQLSDEQFSDKWTAYGWTRKIENTTADILAKIEKDRHAQEDEMKEEQTKFVEEINEIENIVNEFHQYTDLNKLDEIGLNVKAKAQYLKDMADRAKKFQSRELLFGLEQTDYEKVGVITKAFEPYAQLWITAYDWRANHKKWMTDAFDSLEPESMDQSVGDGWRALFKASKAFAELPDCKEASERIKEEIDEFKPLLPCITALRNPGLRERHWTAMSADLGFELMPGKTLNTLHDVIDLKLPDYEEKITKVGESAGKEYAIESALDKMDRDWAPAVFDIAPYRETGSYVLRGADDIQQMLDDNIVMIQAMGFSPFNKPHKERLDKFGAKLNLLSEILEQWLNCQRNWMYLEPIFSSDDIMKQLPAEGQKFKACDRQWRKYLKIANDNPCCLDFADVPDILPIFAQSFNTLEQVQKGLSDYLETKRQSFARFYFLSNEELLEILSQTKDPRAVQPHLRKCFEAVQKVTFEDDLAMVEMFSGEGECVKWDEKVYPEGNVEFWLTDVERMMRMSISTIFGQSIKNYAETDRKVWVLNWPGQIILGCDQVYWSKETEDAIQAHDLKGHYAHLHSQLKDVTTLVRMKLTNMQRVSLGAMITLDVHGRDVIETLDNAGVQKVSDFEWAAQLRYYWLESNEAFSGSECSYLVQVENKFRYGCEYLGNTMRLVVTPLTDRIYLTLTGALGMALGGAPAGPAGTGKTETTKDLAKAMAKQCIVFNCQEGMDYIMVGKFFKGLSMCGAWACFDEFNRINIEVLSVIAQQLLTINQAIVNKLQRFVFEGVEISLNPENASFITMNPGYAGRTELPDNLKVLFRPVACMVPNYALIGEIRLFSFGFERPKELAEKMVNCFKLSSEQLSSQDHYDFGMRAVNTVISSAGLNKKNFPDMDEALLMLRALKDSNLPKFLVDDIVLFTGIIADLFPGVKLPDPDYGSLMEMMNRVTLEMGLQTVPVFMLKAIQLYDVTVLRHGLMTVGPTGGGKTMCKNMLAKTLTQLKKERDEYVEVRQLIMNPKSITMGQLYGSFDDNTHEWADGILCKLFREAVYDTVERSKWVVFDGPVDALWIESMNTVLDENKKLCLVSGEIITMTHWMRMIFEVEDLAVASPATVSRVGIIYLDPVATVGTKSMVTSWLQTIPPAAKKFTSQLQTLFDDILDAAIDFHKRNLKEYVKTVEPNLWRSILNILDGFLKEYVVPEGESVPKEREEALAQNYEQIFTFAIMWGIAGSGDAASRGKFSEWLLENAPKGVPTKGSTFDYSYDVKDCKWKGWMDTVPLVPVDPKKSFSDLVVQTKESVAYSFMIEHICTQLKHVLCVGPTGTGKSLTVKQKLMSGMDPIYTPLFLMFSAQTSANQTQDIIDGKMDKRRKGVYGPPAGKRFCLFIDDMNMPLREVYFAQPPIEILRQWMDHEGWYDRKIHQKNTIVDIMFIGAMGPPGGGRQVVTNRFLRHFNHLAFPQLSDESSTLIFGKILGAHFEAFFPPTMKAVIEPICAASLQIYHRCLKELLPTPSKSHYTFNLRDLARIFQGCMMADPKKIGEEQPVFIRLWAHECMRIFRDRLTDQPDRDWFDAQMKELVKDVFKKNWDALVTTERLFFGDYMVPGADPRLYAEIQDLNVLRKTIEGYLDDFNAQTNKPMRLVMFLDAIDHVSRISRILRQPKGNALLLGVGGSGRQSMTRLAAFTAEMTCVQIEIAKGYGKNEWREDIKKVLLRAGREGKPTVFLFTDSQIVFESFLEDINGVLNSGEVPNIWDMSDVDQIAMAMRPLCQAEGIPLTKSNMHERFLTRVMANLHIVLAFSPAGEAIRTRLRNFPSLVTCCTIDWFTEWPAEALRGVANEAFAEVEFADDSMKQGIVSMCGDIHKGVEKASEHYAEALRRYNYVTPTSYLELLSTFKKVLKEKRDELNTGVRRLSVGLDKLDSTEKDVGVMKVELIDLMPILEKTGIEVEELMKKIEVDKASAGETKAVVEVEEEGASKKAAECKAIADSAQAGLAEALPALAAAVECLKNLKQSDISEVAKYGTPPKPVLLTVEGLCIMFGVKPSMEGQAGAKVANYWPPGKKFLGNAKEVLDNMFNFEKDHIPDKTIKAIQPFIDNPDFVPEKIKLASSACEAMCMWIRAMHTYHFVALEVEPKRIALAAAQAELDIVNKKVAGLQATLKEVTDRLNKLEEEFNGAIKKKNELAAKAEECNVKLDRADRLLGGLGGEKTRWIKTVASLKGDLLNIVGDVIVAAGGIAYLGAFTASYREDQEKQWQAKLRKYQISFSPGAGVKNTLSEPVKIRAWNIAGLPTDSLSTENAIVLSKSRRWGLMIDPQGQANKWIKNTYKTTGLEVIKLTEKDFLRSLVNGVRFGKAVLLENVLEELDPALEPILLKQTFKQGGSEMIKIGDETIAYHPDFNFFLTSKLPNPHYTPETCVKVTLLNFTVNQIGLEDQILGLVVGKERPDLQAAKNQLVISMAGMRKTQKELEDKILKLLAESEGDILADESLIVVLSEAKATSDDITIKVAEAEKTEKEIDETRERYRPTAYRGSLLFFCVSDLALVDPMYQYSLQWFLLLFEAGLENSPAAEEVEQRCLNVNEYFTYSLYKNICRGLFERSKLLFSFTLCIKLMQGSNRIDPMEWRFLLAGATSNETAVSNPAKEWLVDSSWLDASDMAKLEKFKGFDSDFAQNVEAWRAYFDSSTCFKDPLPGKWNDELDLFQKLLILRCLRQDKIQEGIMLFVSDEMEQKFIEPPPFDLPLAYEDSASTIPLIFVLSSGADPTMAWISFAEEVGMSARLDSISLGQGQGPIAERKLAAATKSGAWLLLQNCHLSVSWMPKLEAIVDAFDPAQLHPDFRLWLTAMPSPAFPVSVLQNSVKMTLEPPKGLKANVFGTLKDFNDELFESCNQVDAYKKLCFSLAWFHAVMQERRKFGPLGWNIAYDFSNSDRDCSLKQLKEFLNKYDFVPYKVIVELTGDVNYGGRITDDWDRRCMNTLLKEYVCLKAMEDNHQFSADPNYLQPPIGKHESYLECVKQWPYQPHPEAFGLHENADITCAQNEVKQLFETVLSLQPRVSSGGGLKREDIIDELAANILVKVPSPWQMLDIVKMYPVMYEESMNTVLQQECIRYNKLLVIIKQTLEDVRKALKGLVVMSAELDALSTSVFNNQVPGMWESKAYPSMKPLVLWVEDLLKRYQFIQDWIDKGKLSTYWVSGFFFPQAFLTAGRQNYARKHQIGIDTVELEFRNQTMADHNEITKGPEDGAIIWGIFVEGARWDIESNSLVESRPKELFTSYVPIWLCPVSLICCEGPCNAFSCSV
jgi:dynein heavy chain, axonemal